MKLNPDEIQAAITQKIVSLSSNVVDGSVAPDVHLVNHTGLDSIAILETLVWLEERFDVRIPDEDLNVERFATIAKMTDYVCTTVADS